MSTPTLSGSILRDNRAISDAPTMSVEGVAIKSGVLLAVLGATAVFAGGQVAPGSMLPAWLWPVLIASFVVALIIAFAPKSSPYLAPLYALGEGAVIGIISAYFDLMYPGIVIQAVTGTLLALAAMLFCYVTRLVKVTQKLRAVIVAATLAIAIMYAAVLILNLFGIGLDFLNKGGIFGVGLSCVIIVVAVLNFLLDFERIEKGIQNGAAKYMEWYCAFSLLLTLVWLYLEILRLLAKLKRK